MSSTEWNLGLTLGDRLAISPRLSLPSAEWNPGLAVAALRAWAAWGYAGEAAGTAGSACPPAS
eukprot:4038174-Lingulodinium_polyedra.AAC.1